MRLPSIGKAFQICDELKTDIKSFYVVCDAINVPSGVQDVILAKEKIALEKIELTEKKLERLFILAEQLIINYTILNHESRAAR